MLYHGFDASTPPSRPYPGAHVACGYLGPHGHTPHVWTLDEWNHANGQGTLRNLGIWLADFAATPGGQAQAAAEAAVALGWRAHATPLRFVVIDGEVSLNSRWIRDFGESLLTHGFLAFDYRSAFALREAPSGLAEWVARWDVPPGPYNAEHEGFQYAHDIPFDQTEVDLDIFSEHAWDRFGRKQRRAVPA